MKREEFLNKIKNWESSGRFAQEAAAGGRISVHALSGSGARYFAAAARRAVFPEKKLVYIVPNEFAARRACDDLEILTGERCAVIEPSEYMFYNVLARSRDVDYSRMEALTAAASGECTCLVVPAQALAQYTLPKSAFANCDFYLKEGENYDITETCGRLASMGYVRVPTVDGKRQFAVRGDILDIFPTGGEMPYRVEFYGDTVDMIKIFDPVTQRSTKRVESLSIQPESEFRLAEKNLDDIERRIFESLERKLSRTDSEREKSEYREYAERCVAGIRSGVDFPGQDRFVPFLIGREHTLEEFFGDAFVFAEDPAAVLNAVESVNESHMELCATVEGNGFVPDELYSLYMSPDEVLEILERTSAVMLEPYVLAGDDSEDPDRKNRGGKGKSAGLDDFEASGGKAAASARYSRGREGFFIRMKTLGGAAGNDILVKSMLRGWFESGVELVISCEKSGKFKGIRDELSRIADEMPDAECLVSEPLMQGFECESMGFALASEGTFFAGGSAARKKSAKKANVTDPNVILSDIKPGDYVVHDDHGIGIFMGIETREFEGVSKDYVVVSYAEGGKLYLPSLQLGTLHKYIGNEDQVPRISTLGGRDWQAEKEKVRNSLREYVEELAVLYAKRQTMEGYAFPRDSEWQAEFERRFEFEPTAEQLQCTEQIKRDMEDKKPMERLLCGDVGFGKTEVALRAAFKAVLGGKQVAILVPTTVLAQQHYRTAFERFKDFPVTVDYLCRFRTPKQVDTIKKELKEGKIDIVIGTHMLVAGNVEFKDLGLIVVDEEQRFGVMQKEKLKMRYPRADMLFLSATPIPRTLNMSLSKLRDISIITEPPKSRNPVQTYVIEMNDEIVKNAIYREMARRGQVFFLYNQVKEINTKCEALKRLVPEARICVAHGQMPERELERKMIDFIDRKYDVMLCSTIIESGLDIPNANTIIVENGHRLGLAQLYQIRGRVGRSDVRAYAYITYPKGLSLNPDATRRLETIREFTEFGSGIKVAMRDLEIRGAGTLLGERQSGDVSTIGYDLYCRMINDLITETTGGTVKEEVVVTVDFTVSSYIPGEYVSDPDTRMELYRKLAEIETDADIDDLTDEMLDRFPGEIPDNIIILMHLSRIKALAASCGIKSVIQSGDKIELEVETAHVFDGKIKDHFRVLSDNYRGRFNIMAGEKRIYAEYALSSHSVTYNHLKLIKEVELFLKRLNGDEAGK